MRKIGESRDVDYDPEEVLRWENAGRPMEWEPKPFTVARPLYECMTCPGYKTGDAVRSPGAPGL